MLHPIVTASSVDSMCSTCRRARLPERQSARMSKITNDGLTRPGTGMLYNCTNMSKVGIKRSKRNAPDTRWLVCTCSDGLVCLWVGSTVPAQVRSGSITCAVPVESLHWRTAYITHEKWLDRVITLETYQSSATPVIITPCISNNTNRFLHSHSYSFRAAFTDS